AAEYLRRCCEKTGQLDVKAQCGTVDEAINFLRDHAVDLIFLDVEIPGGLGFQVLDHLSYSPQVILTTSKIEYAYNGFEYSVTDFLKKHFTFKRFQEAMRKVDLAASSKKSAPQPQEGEDHIFIKSDGKLVRLRNDDILYIESMGDYVKFVSSEKKYVALNTIKNLETKVNARHFLKVHRSYIVNIDKVENLRENTLFIKGVEIPVSKACKAEVIRRFRIV
ncbi:MAG TPA: LytTR family DNA-binding domain-containing protein, partial [Chitinophagaceae bacterium]|nr:LytTR family DNA-binding domain-containing protein [Chitinophagaceae bacterium]